MSTANSTIKIKQWNEQPFHEAEGAPKLVRVSVTKSYEGDLAAEGTLEYLMTYGLNGIVTLVGLERITGRLGDRTGSFVILISGTYAGGVPNEAFVIVIDSATGELAGLKGQGKLGPGPEESYVMSLEYDLAPATIPGTV